MKRRHNRAFVIGLLLFTILFTSAYGLLSANLNITGTATGAGDFKIEFTNYNISDETKATVTLDTERTSMNIQATLSYPGDMVTINFTISNTGSLASIVDDLVINENDTADFDIEINDLDNIIGTSLGVGQSTNGSIVISWDIASTTAEPEDVNFVVTITYLQATP